MTKTLSKMIGEMAVIASVRCRVIGMTRQDKQASAESVNAHNAKDGTATVTVKRMPGCEEVIDTIRKIDRRARALLEGYTTQWGDDRRLLMNVFIGDFSGEFEDLRRERNKEVQAFIAKANDYIALAKKNLGGYSVEPPTVDEIKNAFSFEFELTPVPDIDTYSAKNQQLEAALKKRFEDDLERAFKDTQRDLFQRLATPLENMIDRMTEYDRRVDKQANGENVGKEGTFKSTIVTNITDIAKLVRASNFTEDPRIDQLADKLEVFTQIDHKTLVTHSAVRAEAAHRAAEVRASLGAWLD